MEQMESRNRDRHHDLSWSRVAIPGFSEEPIQFTREYWVTRRVLRLIWVLVLTFSLGLMIVAGVLVGEGRLEVHFQLHRAVFMAGCFFTLLAIPISIFGIFQHLENNTKPRLQRHIVRILWLVSISVASVFLATVVQAFLLRSHRLNVSSCDTVFTVGAAHPPSGYSTDKPPMKHWFPLRVQCGNFEFNLVQPWPMGHPFVEQVSWGILNYVVTKPLMTGLTLILQVWDKYGEGEFRADKV
eukprot:1195446-Prorocentrum_minimum.AAC.5